MPSATVSRLMETDAPSSLGIGVDEGRHPAVRSRTKRCFDLIAASCLSAIAALPMAVVALAIRLTMGRPILFRQVRPGLGGEPFTLVKFRTMRDGPADDAARITRLGQLLRSTSLDELPELWNVLRGEMSLVGPRPLLMEYLDKYTERQALRHSVRPGITGLAQVSGRNELSWDEQLKLDVEYVENWSLLLDLRILARTLAAVVRRTGTSEPGQATRRPFYGSTSST